MVVNKIIFFVTIFRNIQFGIIEMINDTKTRTNIQSVVNMNKAYNRRR